MQENDLPVEETISQRESDKKSQLTGAYPVQSRYYTPMLQMRYNKLGRLLAGP